MLRLQFGWHLSIFTLVLLIANIHCSPTRRIDKRAAGYNDDVMSYLMSYGYLPKSDIETGNLRTDDQLKFAIKELQTFGNIPVTGVVDEKTLQLLKRPRCGLPDVQSTQYSHYRKKRYTLNRGPKWTTTDLTWSLRSKNIHNLDQGYVRRALHNAFNVWSRHSKITFKEIDSGNADILIYFERGYHNDGFPFDGRGQILAHAFSPGPGIGGDAHFDQDEEWVLDINDESGGTNLFFVAAHEFGHSLGLSHSSVPESLMFPWYQGWKANFQLPNDDREAIQILYGTKETTRGRPTYVSEKPTDKPVKNIPSYQPPEYYPPLKTPKYYPPRESPKYTPLYRPSSTSSPPSQPSQPTYHQPSDRNRVPDTCDTSYDAVSVIRGELFIFKDKYVWRLGEKGLYPGYPAFIHRVWNSVPSNYTHIDAVYERLDGRIAFFVGSKVYCFNGNVLEHGYPKPLTSLGLPSSLDHIDAAVIWGYNSKTYFFSGSVYWKFDEEIGRVELDYPRDIKRFWKGLEYNLDAAFQWKDGATYFFKGKGFWKLDDRKTRVTHLMQNLSAPVWMGCPKTMHDPRTKVPSDADHVAVRNISKNEFFQVSLFTVIAVVVIVSLVLSIIMTIIIKRKKTYCYTRPKLLGR